jgi:hypothetical protein
LIIIIKKTLIHESYLYFSFSRFIINNNPSHRLRSQDDVSQQQGAPPLSLPEVIRLFETSFVRDENSDPNVNVTVISSQHKVTQQLLSHWQPFLNLKLMLVDSRRAEQLRLSSQQYIVTTVEDSVLRHWGRRWLVLSLRKRMPTSISSSLSRWVDWDRIVVAGSSSWMWWETISVLTYTAHSGAKKAHVWEV